MSNERPTVTGDELYRRVALGMSQAMGDGTGTMDAREFVLIYAELLGDFLAKFVPRESDRIKLIAEFVSLLDFFAHDDCKGETIQ